MSSTELMIEPVELGAGMLGLIGAYAMHAALDVRDLHLKRAPESSPPQPGLAPAETTTLEGLRPRATL